MVVSKLGKTVTADIHGMTAADAKRQLEKLLGWTRERKSWWSSTATTGGRCCGIWSAAR